MANDPGEWYAARREEAKRLEHELAGARQVLVALAAEDRDALLLAYTPAVVRSHLHEVARAVVRRLERALERARSVGD